MKLKRQDSEASADLVQCLQEATSDTSNTRAYDLTVISQNSQAFRDS